MLLMEEAERIAREEHGSGKIAVISGKWERAKVTIPQASLAPVYVQNRTELHSEKPVLKHMEDPSKQVGGLELSGALHL